jgi:hypothetical protein
MPQSLQQQPYGLVHGGHGVGEQTAGFIIIGQTVGVELVAKSLVEQRPQLQLVLKLNHIE